MEYEFPNSKYIANVLFNPQGCYPATYQVEHSFQRDKPVSLNPDHTHFLLVDDGTQNQRGAKFELRARLEKAMVVEPDIRRQSKEGKNYLLCKWSFIFCGSLNFFQGTLLCRQCFV